MDVKPLFQNQSYRFNVFRRGRSSLSLVFGYDSPFRRLFTTETWLLLGALIQSILFLLLPVTYAITPTIFLLTYRIAITLLITVNLLPNPYLKGSIHHLHSAQLPNEAGEHTPPGSETVTVLFLGVKSNHPMGFLDPMAKETVIRARDMFAQLQPDANQDAGFLGISLWHQTDTQGALSNLTISYWKSVAHVHEYALGHKHRAALRWYIEQGEKIKHVGIFHEVYQVPKGGWEAVYVNWQPVLLGATSFLKGVEDGEKGAVEGEQKEGAEWISPLVDARVGDLRRSKGRMGRGLQKDILVEVDEIEA